MLRAECLDHLVLRVADVERSVAWYHDIVGLEVEGLQEWQAGRLPFPSLRINADTIIDVLAGERADGNVDHFCVVVSPVDLDALAESGRFDVVEGPVLRSGARGMGTSLYVRDPDDNVVELRHYG